MSNDGAFRMVNMRPQPIGYLYKLLSDSRRDLAPEVFSAIPDADLKHALNFSASTCAFLYDVDDSLLVTTFLPSDTIVEGNADLPTFNASSYLTAVVPATEYAAFFRTLTTESTENVSVYFERFGEAYEEWYENRTGIINLFQIERHATFPFGSPQARWLVVRGQAVSDSLVHRLRNAFNSHASFTGSLAWTSQGVSQFDEMQMPLVLLYRTYGVTMEPEFSTQLMEPQQMASAIEKWSSVLVGMYVVDDGNIQLLFFKGS
jgi:hypothetical protein